MGGLAHAAYLSQTRGSYVSTPSLLFLLLYERPRFVDEIYKTTEFWAPSVVDGACVVFDRMRGSVCVLFGREKLLSYALPSRYERVLTFPFVTDPAWRPCDETCFIRSAKNGTSPYVVPPLSTFDEYA